jgi:ribose/xylose/arabinose/galactoside ABC-type transport system permease subunit|tara:strand:- start:9 stop:935 length:927 start_codon:yes stop_codon:yes gene_type:complete
MFKTYESKLFLLIILFIILTTFLSDDFLKTRNIQNILFAISVEGLMVIGMTIVMIGRGFDLSIGSVMALSGVLVMDCQHLGIIPSCLIGVLAGLILGLFNGFLVAYIKINPFISTLGTMVMVRGLVMTYTNARPAVGENFDFMMLAREKFFGVPLLFIIFLFFSIIFIIIIKRTLYGRYIYALGGNEEALRLSGVNVKIIKLSSYAICGFFAGLAGVILAARLNTGSPIIGEKTALNVIAAVLLGGTTLSGGVGSIFGSLCGLFSIGITINVMNIFNIQSYIQKIFIGILLILLILYGKRKKLFNKTI